LESLRLGFPGYSKSYLVLAWQDNRAFRLIIGKDCLAARNFDRTVMPQVPGKSVHSSFGWKKLGRFLCKRVLLGLVGHGLLVDVLVDVRILAHQPAFGVEYLERHFLFGLSAVLSFSRPRL